MFRQILANVVLPEISIQSPVSGEYLTSGTHIISGVASDADGMVMSVEVSTDLGANWSDAMGIDNWTYEWTTSGQGSYWFQARATDDQGNVIDSKVTLGDFGALNDNNTVDLAVSGKAAIGTTCCA